MAYFSIQRIKIDNGYSQLFFFWSFSSHRPICLWNDQKDLSHFGQIVWKYKLMNTVTASFNTTVRQMTEMTNVTVKIDQNVSAKKKQILTNIYLIKCDNFIPRVTKSQFIEKSLKCWLINVCRWHEHLQAQKNNQHGQDNSIQVNLYILT